MPFPEEHRYTQDPNFSISGFNPSIFRTPMIEANMIDKFAYGVEIQRGLADYNNINTMEVHPIEIDGSILLYNKESHTGITISISKINDIRTTNVIEGSFRKRQNEMVEIEFQVEAHSNKTILLDMDDKKINEFKQQVFSIKKKLQDINFWTLSTLRFESNSSSTIPTEIYPMVPFLSPGEQIVWDSIETKGIFSKKVKWLDSITNYRIYQYDYENHLGNFVLIPAVDDVVVTNSHRISSSNSTGTYVKSPYTTTGYGNAKTTSKTVGDISVFADGKPYIVFRNVIDPNGVSKLIKSVKKQCRFTVVPNQFKTSNNIPPIPSPLLESKKEHAPTSQCGNQSNSNNKIRLIQCSKCHQLVEANAKFCDQCGNKQSRRIKCSSCNNINLSDAVFCNSCGERLV